MTQLTSMCEIFCQFVQKKQEEKRIEEKQVAKAQTWKLPVCCDDDDDEENVSKDTIEDLSQSNEEFSSTDDDSFSLDNIDYVEASPPDSELVSSEVMEIVIPETKSSSTSLNSLLEETNNFH
nr:hypothetical protein [Tanacetum cinerariifolium]